MEHTKAARDSRGEVFTPLEIVNEMLDILPVEVWSNPNLKWLDNSCGNGNFLYAVAIRLLESLKSFEPDDKKRLEHIIGNMIYGVEIFEDNYNAAVGRFLFSDCAEEKLNIANADAMTFDYCFPSRDGKMECIPRFDIIVGNPPYNKPRNQNGSSQDLYPEFVKKSAEMADYVLYITPSRWFGKDGKVMEEHRKNMVMNFGLKRIVELAKNPFGNTEIKGGISYFLLEKGYNGNVQINNEFVDLRSQLQQLGCLIPNIDILTQSGIVKMAKKKNIVDLYCSASFFKINTNDARLKKEKSDGDILCHLSGQKGSVAYFPIDQIPEKKKKYVEMHKITYPAAYGKGNEILNKCVKYVPPNEIVSGSFVFFAFEKENEARNFKETMETSKILLNMMKLKKIKQHIYSQVFDWVPLLDSSKVWSDDEIAEFCGLTETEKQSLMNI
jgi:site-specific DNA-methyltransferase (adenine-specific)